MTLDEYDYLFKIVIIGDSSVGKSNLMSRFTTDEFNPESEKTIGVNFATRIAKIGNHVVNLQFWDTSGQDRYRAITGAYYRGAVSALLVYDITNPSSFDNIKKWLKEVREYGADEIVLALVGNKLDLAEGSRAISTEEAAKYAQDNNMLFLETSALDSTNVGATLETVINRIYEMMPKPKNQEEPRT